MLNRVEELRDPLDLVEHHQRAPATSRRRKRFELAEELRGSALVPEPDVGPDER